MRVEKDFLREYEKLDNDNKLVFSKKTLQDNLKGVKSICIEEKNDKIFLNIEFEPQGKKESRNGKKEISYKVESRIKEFKHTVTYFLGNYKCLNNWERIEAAKDRKNKLNK